LNRSAQAPAGRKIGTNTILYVNFDGVELGDCEPSNSKKNCSWIRPDTSYEPWSGTLQTKLAIMASARKRLERYGVRVTGLRPDDSEDYTMIVYGGDADEEGVLGLAPGGDCNDSLPNQVGFAFLDGDRRSWSAGGGTTLVHEAGHTWGLDHIDERLAVMNPFGDNSVTDVSNFCQEIVVDSELTPGETRCPELSMENCGALDKQHSAARLIRLFGAPYVDDTAPVLTLRTPFDGWYEQGPDAAVSLEVDIWDDVHPQIYDIEVEIPGAFDQVARFEAGELDFDITGLPLGTWTIQIRAWDEAGNRGDLSFEVEIGDIPRSELPLDDGCNSISRRSGDNGAALAFLFVLTLARPRRRR
jgi:hypothetical protein